LRAAGGLLECQLTGRGRQVTPDRIELGGRAGGVGILDALLELVGVQATGDGVLAQLGGDALTILIRDPEPRARERVLWGLIRHLREL
jgi:hypothetical protein